jgi:preprotein translocase SecE subunit
MESKTPQAPSSIPVPKATRGGLKGYIHEVNRELKKVDWPPVKETNRLTGVVLAICLLLAGVMTLLSFAIKTIIDVIQGKL